MKASILAVACTLALTAGIGVASANTARPPFGLTDPEWQERYTNCIDRAAREPDQAYEDAMAWKSEGGSSAADHCAAIALVAAKRYPEAAERLDRLARMTSAGDAHTRGQILSQAGNAWLLAGEPDLAAKSFSTALTLAAGDPDILIDRARAYAILGKWPIAEADLGAALKTNPQSIDAMVLRAAARRAQGNVKGADGDITRALLIDANHPDALVEYGLLRQLRGDKAGAREAFLAVLAKAPESAAAETARREIEKLDVKADGGIKPMARPAAPAPQPTAPAQTAPPKPAQ